MASQLGISAYAGRSQNHNASTGWAEAYNQKQHPSKQQELTETTV